MRTIDDTKDVLINLWVRGRGKTSGIARCCMLLARFREPGNEVHLSFRSKGSRGQTMRRLRKRLEKLGLSPASFKFDDCPHSARCVVTYLPGAGDDGSAEPEPVDPGACDFRARLTRVRLEDRPGRTLAALDWEVADGPKAGAIFSDKVLVFPPNERAFHFSRAVGVPEERLAEGLQHADDLVVIVRRTLLASPDGPARPVHHYYAVPSR